MTLTINLTPTEEDRLSSEAKQSGLDASALAEKLVRDHLASGSKPAHDAIMAKLREWQEETQTVTYPSMSAHDLFAKWAEEDANLTDEEVEANDQLWEDFKHGIDDERRNSGMRTLFDS